MSDFDDLMGEISRGVEGKNSGINMGFGRLDNYISLRKAMYFLIGGFTGSGKTSFIDDAFVLNPIDQLLTGKSDVDYNVLYWSMERRKNFKLAKWIGRKIFLDTGQVIPINRLMGWVSKSERLTPNEHDLVKLQKDYIGNILERVTIFEGPENPTGIRSFVDNYAKKEGIFEKIDEYRNIYIPNNPDKMTVIVRDTIGLHKKEKGLASKKEIIDKASEDNQKFRDKYGYIIVDVSQFNRDISSPLRLKNGDVEPMLEDFKETGSTQENADIVLSLFDPMRYNVDDITGYDLIKLRDSEGGKRYRSLKILKNSYGVDSVRIGLAMQPAVGVFKEMKKLKDMRDLDYDNIIDNTYFYR